MKKIWLIGLIVLMVGVWSNLIFGMESFNLSTDNLPKNYQGNNTVKIYQKIKNKTKEKDEFEATEKYKERIITAISIEENSCYTFTGDILYDCKYDADTQTLTIPLWPSRKSEDIIKGGNNLKLPFLKTNLENFQSSTYTGTNAFGATIKISKKRGDFYGIAVLNNEDLVMGDSLLIIHNIPPNKDRVETLKKCINRLVIWKPKRPEGSDKLIEKDSIYEYKRPTFDSPYDETFGGYWIFGEILEIWIYDKDSGKILWKKRIKSSSQPYKNIFKFRPVEKWVGEKFIFLPKPELLQEFGYDFYEGGKGRFGHPTYEEAVGRVGTVTEVIGSKWKWKSDDYEITLQMDDNKQIYTTSSHKGKIRDVASVSDIENARAEFLGKTLWSKIENFSMEKGGTLQLKKGTPLKVARIDYSSSDFTLRFSPIRFYLQTPSGEVVYEDINLSGTNVYKDSRDEHRLGEYFFIGEDCIKHLIINDK